MKLYTNTLVSNAERYARECHYATNHTYNGHPYSVHLQQVVQYGQDFIYLIPDSEIENVIAACWVHDVIEDCRQTYNDVLKATNKNVADIAYALTNEKGKTRKERAGERYYEGIRETPYATYVKICDRLANVFYSKQTGSRMFNMYLQENQDFYNQLYDERYTAMFIKLDELFDLN